MNVLRRRLCFLGVSLLIVSLYIAVCLYVISKNSPTYNEAWHALSVHDLKKNDRCEIYSVTPILLRRVTALFAPLDDLEQTLPLGSSCHSFRPSSLFLSTAGLNDQCSLVRTVYYGRIASVGICSACLAITLWLLYGVVSCRTWLAVGLLYFLPMQVAHACVFMSDGVVSSLSLLFATQIFVCWVARDGNETLRWAGLGVTSALLVSSKYTGLVVLASTLVLPALCYWRAVFGRLELIAWASVVHCITIGGLYADVAADLCPASSYVSTVHGTYAYVSTLGGTGFPYPNAYANGLTSQDRFGSNSNRLASYFFGYSSSMGARFFFLAVFWKYPLSILFTSLIAMLASFSVLWKETFCEWSGSVLVLSGGSISFGVLSALSQFDMHTRYVMPSMLMILVGGLLVAERAISIEVCADWRRSLLKIVPAGICVFTAMASACSIPYPLGYSSSLCDDDQIASVLALSDSDWGQGLFALDEYNAKRNPTDLVPVAYFGSMCPEYITNCTRSVLPADLDLDSAEGCTQIAVSETLIYGHPWRPTCGTTLRHGGFPVRDFSCLRETPYLARVGGSIRVFDRGVVAESLHHDPTGQASE